MTGVTGKPPRVLLNRSRKSLRKTSRKAFVKAGLRCCTIREFTFWFELYRREGNLKIEFCEEADSRWCHEMERCGRCEKWR